jgi:hypothetical protein
MLGHKEFWLDNKGTMLREPFRDLPNNAVVILTYNSAGMLDTQQVEDAFFTHKKCVFSDPEFIAAVEAIKNDFFDTYRPVKQVNNLKDDGMIEQYIGTREKPFTKTQLEAIHKLVENFRISKSDVVSFMNNLSGASSVISDRVTFAFTNEAGLHIRIASDASKYEVETMVANLDEAMGTVYGTFKKVSKPILYYDLVYAVFRAYSNGYKFKDIQFMLENHALPLYLGSKTFTSIEALKNYYYKNRPKVTT